MGRPKSGFTKLCVVCDTPFYVCSSQAHKYSCCSANCGSVRRSQLKTRFSHGLSKTPEMRRLWVRRCKLKQKYNLTIKQWEAIFTSQGRRCAACGSSDPKGKVGWHTDHDHVTNNVRGILCHNCNVTLGLVHDSVAHLNSLVNYLQEKA